MIKKELAPTISGLSSSMQEETLPKVDDSRPRLQERKLSSKAEELSPNQGPKIAHASHQKELFKVLVKSPLFRIQATTGEPILSLAGMQDEDSEGTASDPTRLVM